MNFKSQITQKKYFILGAAQSGISAAILLHSKGISVFVSEAKIISETSKTLLTQNQIPFEENGHNFQNLCKNFDICVVSPGIPLTTEAIVKAKAHNIEIISEIELSLQFLNPKTKLVGITGTNGKSTTTHYLAHLLNTHKITTAACGNIGTPLSEVIFKNNDYDALSIELSSYQLESGISKKFDVAILLNLQNDHLARHKTFENYLRAKWNLVLATRDDGLCIIDEAVLHMARKFNFPFPKCKIINTVNNNFNINEPCLMGAHNETNIYVASCAAMALGVSPKTVLQEWEKSTSKYSPLAHRLEKIASNHPKTFINDSKATNVESTLVALKSIQKPIHLLLGGEPKGDSYLPIAEFLGKNIKRVYPFGKAAPQICKDLNSFSEFLAEPSNGMISASQKALNQSENHEIILLSPACSSFDEFKNFEHRGNVFKNWVTSQNGDVKNQ